LGIVPQDHTVYQFDCDGKPIVKLPADSPVIHTIVVDNEAGMEHISRGLLPVMETAILVSDCSRRGVQAAGRIAKLMTELKLQPQNMGLIINRAPEGRLDAGTLEEIEIQGLPLLGIVPQDHTVYQFDCDGKPIVKLPADSPVRAALGKIVKNLKL